MPDQILVLVAEDEDLVRLVIVDVLEDAGFEVMQVGHAAAALDILQIHAPRVHVLFTDIHMPGKMNGLALAHHTAKQRKREQLSKNDRTPLCPSGNRSKKQNLPEQTTSRLGASVAVSGRGTYLR
jgi:CheY-like chemotaxis protein